MSDSRLGMNAALLRASVLQFRSANQGCSLTSPEPACAVPVSADLQHHTRLQAGSCS